MRKSLTKLALTASIALALAFTFSCSSDDSGSSGGGGGNPNIKYGSLPYEGKNYKTVKIGEQTWMAENLNYAVEGSKCYGEDFQVVVGLSSFVTISPAEIQANCKKYGRLYDWATAMDIDAKYNSEEWGGSNVKHRGICPPQWHIPSLEEWYALLEFAGENPSHGEAYKRLISSDWKRASGTDDFGFAALPGGYARIDGERSWFSDIGDSEVASRGAWHVAGEQSAEFTEVFYLFSFNYLTDSHGFKEYLFSIRCVKD